MKYFGGQQKHEKNGSAHLRKDDQSKNGPGTLSISTHLVAPEDKNYPHFLMKIQKNKVDLDILIRNNT